MLENTFCTLTVGFFIWGEDEKIVHINDEPSFCNHVSEGIVHEPLERCGGVSEFKEHHGWFKESFVDDEGGFPLVAVFDADIVVTLVEVKLGE